MADARLGACGAAGALAAPLIRSRLSLAIFCCLLGFGFSAFMDVWNWLAFFPHTWQALAATWARGLSFDAAHARDFVIALVVRTGATADADATDVGCTQRFVSA